MLGHNGRIGAGAVQAGRPDPLRSASLAGAGPNIGADDVVLGGLSGAVLDLSAGPDDLKIVLLGRNGETLLSLGPFAEEDVIAQWRSLALSSGLTPMLRAADGRIEPMGSQIGRLRVGPVRARRPRTLRRRRPRFLVRRKSARLPQRPLVYRESEIARGAGA